MTQHLKTNTFARRTPELVPRAEIQRPFGPVPEGDPLQVDQEPPEVVGDLRVARIPQLLSQSLGHQPISFGRESHS